MLFLESLHAEHLSPKYLYLHGGAVGQDLSHACGNFVGIVTHANDGIGAELSRVFHHQLMCVGAGSFAELRIEGNIAAEQSLKARADVSDDTAGTNYDAAHNTEVL